MLLLQVNSYRCAYVKNSDMHGVVLAGGWNRRAIETSYVFDLTTEKWQKMGNLGKPRYQLELIVIEVNKQPAIRIYILISNKSLQLLFVIIEMLLSHS